VSEAKALPGQSNMPGLPASRELIAQAEKGDSEALSEVQRLFDESPGAWTTFGDLAANTQRSWIQLMAGQDELLREAAERYLEKMQAEIGGPSPTPLERLLVDRIATCWLALQQAETAYAQNLRRLDSDQGEYYQRRIDRTQRRYFEAIRSLALIRRMLQPMVQVNIAERQVNIATPAEGLP
jgi:hypothetical protein